MTHWQLIRGVRGKIDTMVLCKGKIKAFLIPHSHPYPRQGEGCETATPSPYWDSYGQLPRVHGSGGKTGPLGNFPPVTLPFWKFPQCKYLNPSNNRSGPSHLHVCYNLERALLSIIFNSAATRSVGKRVFFPF